MRGIRGPVVSAIAAVGVLVATPAAAMEISGNWRMEEGSNASVMTDASPNNLDGNIGSDVITGRVSSSGSRFYHFEGPSRVVNDERLVLVPDNPRLDPGTSEYSITIRFRTSAGGPNIIQKGQSETSGGMWKLVLKTHWPRCHFRDGNHNTKAIGFVNSPLPQARADDGQWHILQCERLSNGVRVTMDEGTQDEMKRFIKGSIGNIDNRFPLSIGGKSACNGQDVTCDYLNGDIDWIRIEKG